MSLSEISAALKSGRRFLLTTHKDPDGDGIGSMLALGRSLSMVKKEVVLFAEEPLPPPYDLLKGAEGVADRVEAKEDFDAVIALDCAEESRLGNLNGCLAHRKLLINIDHHETNDFFGDLNLVDPGSSSTGEVVFGILKQTNLPIDFEVAENLFVAIQTDTGSFRYSNATPSAFKAAAELMEYGVKPWEVSQKIMDHYPQSRLSLLQLALDTVEFHHQGRIGLMTLSSDLYDKAHADRVDGERFVDYPRYVEGVEMAVLIRQIGEDNYKFSLRSNDQLNVGKLALKFGGGGHARAAGFEAHGSLESLKKDFLEEAVKFLNGKTH